MMTSSEAYKLKAKVLKINFEKYFKDWKEQGCQDDRLVFANMYAMQLEAYKAMESVENNLICVAFNKEDKERRKTMSEIVERFK